MSEFELKLKPFAQRIRLLRAWRGLAVGLLAGGVLSAIWAVLDWYGVLFTEWLWMGILTAFCVAAGTFIGYFMKLPSDAVAQSVDRRASLKDRLGTAVERTGNAAAFDEALQTDARSALGKVAPREVYPVKVGNWQYASLTACVIASMIFLLGNSGILLDDKGKKAKEELSKIANQVERVAKPLEEAKENGKQSEKEKLLAKELKKFAQELRKARFNKEEAMQKANQLSEKAKEISKEKTQQTLAKMQSADEKLAQMRLEKANLTKEDLDQMKMDAETQNLMDQMMEKSGINKDSMQEKFSSEELSKMGMDPQSKNLMNLSPEQREQLKDSITSEISKLEAKEASGKTLSESEKKLMEQLKKLMEKLKLSEKAMKAIEEIKNSKEYKELQELMQKMQKASQQQSKEGKPLSDEELKDLEKAMEDYMKEMEELAEKWGTKEGQEEIKQMMKDALEKMKQGQGAAECDGMCLGLFGLSGAGMGSGLGGNGGGASGPGDGGTFQGTDKINTLTNPVDSKAKTQTTAVKGERDDKRGTESYTEIKAPTMNGSRTTVPYSKVLPKYKSQAESALNKKQIPKEHEKRVKKYFDSLTGASK